MKRLPVDIRKSRLMQVPAIRAEDTYKGSLPDSNELQSISPCWSCLDLPCKSIDGQKILSALPDHFGASDSNFSVCPTGALAESAEGVVSVDESLCIGCGLCSATCPTGSIYLQLARGKAEIKPVNGVPTTPAIALEARNLFAQLVSRTQPRSELINEQVQLSIKLRTQVFSRTDVNANVAMRLLVRNSLISIGVDTTLRSIGASSRLTEICGREGARTILIETSSRDDTLDAFRRLLAAAATAMSKYGYKKGDLFLALVVPQLPNRRVDLYRLLSDAKKYLDLEIRVIPVAALLVSNLLQKSGFVSTFQDFSPVENQESLSEIASTKFGFEINPEFGFEPEK